MKKAIASFTASLLLLTALALPVGAAATDLAAPGALLPVDIVLNQEAREIRKVYDLPPSTDPSTLPRDPFDRDGCRYDCTDILREVIIGSETQPLTQTETVESEKKDMETLLALLPQEKEVTTEEGFSGTLRLDLDSIKTEPSGYGSKTSPVTASRSYPNLSDADTKYLPKTIEEGGRTLVLQDVQWRTDNTYNADDYEIGDRFTAVCTYGGTKTSSYVKGYTTTADYTGEVYRTGVTVIRYTVIYTGVPIEPPTPEPVEAPKVDVGRLAIIGTLVGLAAMAAGGGITYLFLELRKERAEHEKTAYSGHSDTDADTGDGGAGHGSGV